MARTVKGSRAKILQQIQTPLGLYVLALLIIEATLAIVLTAADFDQEHKWLGFLWMIGVFAALVMIVTVLTALNPKTCYTAKRNIPHRKSSPLP